MNIAIVYYSFDGNCALVAKTLQDVFTASGKTADVVEIKTADTKKRTGAAKYFWGGRQVLTRKKPALQSFDFDPSGYDLLVLGAPVWAGSPAPAMASFLDAVNISGKRAALFCCHGGGKGRALEKFRALLPGNTVAGEIDIIDPAKRPEGFREKLQAWAESLG